LPLIRYQRVLSKSKQSAFLVAFTTQRQPKIMVIALIKNFNFRQKETKKNFLIISNETFVFSDRDVAATWNYKRIKTNVYFDVAKPVAKGYEMQACHCRIPRGLANPDSDTLCRGCGEDCINRMTYTECDTQLCPLPEDLCSNRRIQRQRSSALTLTLERFMTDAKGWGVKTKTSIAPGDFIMEYVGEVVSEKEFKLRMLTEYIEDTHHYCLHLDSGMVIDGHRMGNECRFVNHSCEPNCEMQKWNVNGHYRYVSIALLLTLTAEHRGRWHRP
jgi:histone-lysine N-methyltransferase ASH1L